MRERPILLNAEMARATLEDRKTQTRRTRGLDEINKNPEAWKLVNTYVRDGCFYAHFRNVEGEEEHIKCPYGVPGNRLWVRETWAHIDDYTGSDPGGAALAAKCFYRADYGALDIFHEEIERWRPSIFMPRWACRTVLEITNIRVERVQEISEAEVQREGTLILEPTGDFRTYRGKRQFKMVGKAPTSQQKAKKEDFLLLWNSINDKRGFGWDVNPWLWPITFKRIS